MKSRVSRILVNAALVLSIALLMGMLIGTPRHATHAQSPDPAAGQHPGQTYSDTIRETYNFHFGKDNMSLPGNAATVGNEFIQPGAFPDRRVLPPLPRRGLSPVASVPPLELFPHAVLPHQRQHLVRTKGIEYSRHCDSCHNPDRRAVSGALTQDSQVDRASTKTA